MRKNNLKKNTETFKSTIALEEQELADIQYNKLLNKLEVIIAKIKERRESSDNS